MGRISSPIYAKQPGALFSLLHVCLKTIRIWLGKSDNEQFTHWLVGCFGGRPIVRMVTNGDQPPKAGDQPPTQQNRLVFCRVILIELLNTPQSTFVSSSARVAN